MAFVGLVSLESLDLSGNQLDGLEQGTFAGLEKLTDLRLMGNRLASLSDNGAFDGLSSLQSLHLEDNELVRCFAVVLPLFCRCFPLSVFFR